MDQNKPNDALPDDAPEPGTPLNAPDPAAVTPIEDQLTLHPDDSREPTGAPDGRPDAFLPGDQTAAGALTPPGGQHPGEPSGYPGRSANVLDPYNVNGTAANGAAIEQGQGLQHPELDKPVEPTKDHPRADD